MEQNKLFFSEYEFIKDADNYWFPVLINAKSETDALLVKEKIEHILSSGFKMIRAYPLKPYMEAKTYSDALRPFVEARARAEVLTLNLRQLQLVSIDKDKGIRFNQHIVIVPQNLLMAYSHTIHFHLDKLSFLTTQFHNELDYEKEFLVLRIY